MSKTLYIYGCSGIGKSIVDSVSRLGEIYTEQVFVDDDETKQAQSFYGCRVVSFKTLELQANAFDDIILAYFKPSDIFTRDLRANELRKSVKAKFVTIIDSSAAVSPSALIGEGVYIAPKAVVDSDAKVGDHCVILFNSVVSREVLLANSTFLSAGVVVKGSVEIHMSSFLSANVVVTKNISAHVFINAGVCVTDEVGENCVISANGQVATVHLGQNTKRAVKKLRFFHP